MHQDRSMLMLCERNLNSPNLNTSMCESSLVISCAEGFFFFLCMCLCLWWLTAGSLWGARHVHLWSVATATHHHGLLHHVDAVALHQLLEQIEDLFCPGTLERKDSWSNKQNYTKSVTCKLHDHHKYEIVTWQLCLGSIFYFYVPLRSFSQRSFN